MVGGQWSVVSGQSVGQLVVGRRRGRERFEEVEEEEEEEKLVVVVVSSSSNSSSGGGGDRKCEDE